MSNLGDDFNIYASILFEVDPQRAAQAMQDLTRNQAAFMREWARYYERVNGLSARAYAEHTRQLRQADRDRDAARKRELADHESHLRSVEQAQKQADRSALLWQDHRAKERRNISRQVHEEELAETKQGFKKELQAQKTADAEAADVRRMGHRRILQSLNWLGKQQTAIVKGTQDRLTSAQKAKEKESLQQQKAADNQSLEQTKQAGRLALEAARAAHRRELIEAKGAQDRLTATEAAAAKKRLQDQEAASRRRETRYKAFWSVMRSMSETAGRHLVNDTRSMFMRMFSHQQAHERRSLLSWRSHNAQVAAVNRASIVQQGGIIATARSRTQTGVLGGLGNLRGLIAGAGGYLSARAIFGNLQEYEQTQIAFTNLLGSVEAADTMLADLQQFNVATPFDLPAITSSAKQLLAMGESVEEIVPDLTAIGDVGAKFAASADDVQGVVRALGQMSQAARVNAQDINQIQQRFVGFNARAAIARGLGVSLAEAMEMIASGAITGNEGMNAMIEGMRLEENAAGAMAEQMESLSGRISNFGDMLYMIQIQVLGPFIDDMARAVEQATIFIDSLYQGEGVWETVRSGLLGVAAAMGVLVSFKLLDWVRIAILGINPLTATFIALGAGLSILIREVPEVGNAFGDMFDVVRSSFDEIGGAFAALFSGDIEGFVETFTTLGQDLWEAIQPAFAYIGEQLGNLYSYLAPILIDAWDTAFTAVSDWIQSGGVERVVQATATAVGSVLSTAVQFIASNIGPVLIAGLTAIGLSTIGLLPTLLIAAAGTALYLYREKIAEALSNLPALMMAGLYELGRFLGGPAVETIFSESGQKIMLAILGGALAGVTAFAAGLVDGLRQSLPKVFDTFNDLVQSGITLVFDSLGTLGDALFPIEVILRSVTSVIEGFARILGIIPTPVYLAAAAIGVLVKAWLLLKKAYTGSWAEKSLQWIGQIPQKMQAASTSMGQFSGQVQSINRTFAGQQMTMGRRTITGMATAAGTASTAFAGVAQALPGIATAALIGIPIVMGLIESARSRQEAWRRSIGDTARAMSEGTGSIESMIRGSVTETDGFAAALSELNVEIDTVVAGVTNGAEAIGMMYRSASPELARTLDELGISAQQFGEAAAEGDAAVRQLGQSMGQGSDFGGAWLETVWRRLPEAFRDIADRSTEVSLEYLEQRNAAGALTRAQRDLYDQILSGEAPQARAIELADELRLSHAAQTVAIERNEEVVEALTQRFIDAQNETNSFRESVDRLTGSAIEVGRARQSVEGTFDALATGIAEGQGINDLSEDILSAADGIVGMFEAIAESGRPGAIREARGEYQRLRGELVNQMTQLLGNRDLAEQYTNALVPNADEIIREMRRAQRETARELRRQYRNLMSASFQRGLSPQEVEALQERALEIQATLAGYGFEVEVTPRLRRSDASREWRQQAIEDLLPGFEVNPQGGVDIPFTLIPQSSPTGGGGGNGAPQFRGIAGGSGGGFGGAVGGGAGLPPVEAWGEWARSVVAIMSDVAEGTGEAMQKMLTSITSVLRDIDRSFKRWGAVMEVAGGQIGNAIVSSLTTALKAGTSQVAGIIRGYGNTIVGSLNPILRSVGKDPIQLSFARGGVAGPNIASPGDGPIVHIYNEGRGGTGSRYGEAYIPFDPSLKSRSRDLTSRTVQRLGGHVEWFANGGITTPVPNVDGNWQGLHPEFARRLSAWAASMGTTYTVGSGYRSFERQAELYAAYLAGEPGQAPAAPPGTSLHNFGLASDGPHWSGRNEGAYRLDYPMSYEPWHVQVAEGKGFIRDGFVPFNPIPRPPDAGKHGILSQVGRAVMDFVYNAALSFASSLSGSAMPSIGAFGASPEVMAGIRRAMGIVGVPSSWMGPLLTLIERESGFNPQAYNSTLGASGLMQTIPSTFAAYALPGLGGIFDIVANVVAGLRYILSRYGSIFNVGQAVSPSPTSGYYSGGIITSEGLYRAGEYGRRELILPIENPGRTADLLIAHGVADALGRKLDLGHSATSRASTPKVDININLEGGDIDPVLYDGLTSAVRSGVAEGLARSERVEDSW